MQWFTAFESWIAWERSLRFKYSATASFAQTKALPVLRELALVPDDEIATEAIRKLASLSSNEELETFLNQHDQELCAEALAALDELLYMQE